MKMSSEIQEQELLAKKIKHGLENWREIVLPVYDTLLWKNVPIHPGIIFGATTITFILILLLDPTLLSFLSSSCLCLVILDYAAPIVISKAFNPDSWTGPKEKKLDEICSSLAKAYVSVRSDIGFFLGLKETRPKLYYVSLIVGLLILSWVGNNVNNVFLTYLFFTASLMLPGLKHNGYLQKYSSLIRQCIAQTLRSTINKKEKNP